MKPSTLLHRSTRTGRLALMGAVLLLFGCQSLIFDPRGHLVPEEKRIAIPDSGEEKGVFKNEDLTITYKMVKTPGQLAISGDIRFTDRISENFPIVQYFHLGAMLLDDQGKILDLSNLASVAYYQTQYATIPDYPLLINTRIALSGNTRFMAFHYTGKAYDPSEPDGGTMDFWEYPAY
jgi:hypothetical protein